MEITGKIIQVLEPRKGISARTGNEWVCGQYVLETIGEYPRKMAFDVFGSDKMQQFNIQLGEVLNVSFDIDAREYQGKWYNSIRAFRVNRDVQTPTGPVAPQVTPAAPTQTPDLTAGAPFDMSDSDSELPF